MEEFRDSVGAATVGVEWDDKTGGLVGLDALQERVQEKGRKAVDDKIKTFQVGTGGAWGCFFPDECARGVAFYHTVFVMSAPAPQSMILLMCTPPRPKKTMYACSGTITCRKGSGI